MEESRKEKKGERAGCFVGFSLSSLFAASWSRVSPFSFLGVGKGRPESASGKASLSRLCAQCYYPGMPEACVRRESNRATGEIARRARTATTALVLIFDGPSKAESKRNGKQSEMHLTSRDCDSSRRLGPQMTLSSGGRSEGSLDSAAARRFLPDCTSRKDDDQEERKSESREEKFFLLQKPPLFTRFLPNSPYRFSFLSCLFLQLGGTTK